MMKMTENLNMNMNIVEYSEKCIVLSGETKPFKEEIKNMGGKWNGNLKNGLKGWIFSSKKREIVENWLKSMKPQTQEKPQEKPLTCEIGTQTDFEPEIKVDEWVVVIPKKEPETEPETEPELKKEPSKKGFTKKWRFEWECKYSNMTVKELRDICRERKISQYGIKDKIIEKLKKYDIENN